MFFRFPEKMLRSERKRRRFPSSDARIVPRWGKMSKIEARGDPHGGRAEGVVQGEGAGFLGFAVSLSAGFTWRLRQGLLFLCVFFVTLFFLCFLSFKEVTLFAVGLNGRLIKMIERKPPSLDPYIDFGFARETESLNQVPLLHPFRVIPAPL